MRKANNNAVAAKTMEKIAKEENKLIALENKRDELDNAIKECKAEIARLKEQANQEKLQAIGAATVGKNISLDELLLAIASGDLLTLQEKIEENTTITIAETPVESPTSSDETDDSIH